MTEPQADALAVATEKLNATIARAEAAFAARFKVAAVVELPDRTKLVFGKRDRAWRISITGRVSGKPLLLADANRQIRAETLAHLPLLFAELERQSTDATAEIESAVASATAFLSSIEAAA